jgi:hypothetical protein
MDKIANDLKERAREHLDTTGIKLSAAQVTLLRDLATGAPVRYKQQVVDALLRKGLLCYYESCCLTVSPLGARCLQPDAALPWSLIQWSIAHDAYVAAAHEWSKAGRIWLLPDLTSAQLSALVTAEHAKYEAALDKCRSARDVALAELREIL